MKNIKAIFKREFKSYFDSPVAYVFLTAFLVLIGFMTFGVAMFYERRQADLTPFFFWHPWVYLLLVPAATMGLWADERRNGTAELVLTLPMTVWEVLVGKFLAAWAFMGVALALTFPVALTAGYLGSPDWGAVLCGYLGSFLLAGAAAGLVTGFLQTTCKIHPILAGILTMSGLYTVNITILGGPNVSLLDAPKFYELLGGRAAAVLLVDVLAVALLCLFFRTAAGLCIRASGSNEDMVRSSSINTAAVRLGALSLSNAMVALSGGILAQCQGFGDIGSGSGMIVIGLASVILGEVLFGRRSVTLGLISAVFGSVGYRILLALALRYNLMTANSLKLLSAVIVAITLSLPALSAGIRSRRRRKENRPC